MVHGLGANHFNFDFPHAASPAALYYEAGYDVWTIDLRGHCHSSHGRGQWFRWGFDQFANEDIPAALALISRETDNAPVHWLGHSMGGMLFYAVAGESCGASIRSAVTLGSPVSFYGSTRLERWAWRNHLILNKLPMVPVQTFLRWLNPLLPWGPQKVISSQMYPENVDWQTIHKAAFHATSNVSMVLLLDFARWVATGAWDSSDGSVDYRARLAEINVPALIVSGSGDNLCPATDIRKAYDLLGTAEKKYLMAGLSAGYQSEYGHIDLVFGRHAGQEVIAEAIAWTDSHRVRD